MPAISCPLCEFQTADVGEDLANTILSTHALSHRAAPATPAPTDARRLKAPQLDRPKISRGTSPEEWNTFTQKWGIFKNGSDIPPNQLTAQLLQCCDKELEDDVLKDMSDIPTATEAELLQVIKNLAVISMSTSVRQNELIALKQDHGQPIRSYSAQLKGKARTCSLFKACGCGQRVDYTDEIVKMVILNGISNNDIQQEVLGTPGIDDKSLNDTISLIENKEMAARAMLNSSTHPPRQEPPSSSVHAVNASTQRIPQETQVKLAISLQNVATAKNSFENSKSGRKSVNSN